MAETTRTVYFEEPKVAKWLFGSSRAAWIWLVVRLWLGWEWLRAGWTKVFGGNITWRPWDWTKSAYSLTGDGNIGWIRSGTVKTPKGVVHMGVGDAVSGFAQNAIRAKGQGTHPDVAYSWYVHFLEWVRDTAYPVLGPVVAIGEVVIGVALIIGAFTGIAAFFGLTMNFSYVFAGTAGINPAMILAGGLLILAWRVAGWYGVDRYLLPKLGTPWHRGEVFEDPGKTPAPS
jgi:thiosulfate dehydrogenase (quinone) large subunit